MLISRLQVTVAQNHVSVRNMESNRSASADAPFSCEHLLVDDIDILEHAVQRLFRQVAGRAWWTFPRVEVSTADRPIHAVERKIIQDALLNAGASRVGFHPSVQILDEHSAPRQAYIAEAGRKR